MSRSTSSARQTTPEQLRSEVDAQVALERRQALRALLMQPLLPAGGPHAGTYRLVRRHQEYLQTWFAHWPDWTLRVQPGLARLEKTASSDDDATRGAVDPTSRMPFTRRRYALFCLTLAVIGDEERQTTLRQVADRLSASARMDHRLSAIGFELDLRTQSHRRDLVAVIRLLAEFQILVRVDGDDTLYLRGDGDCLYRIDHALASTVLNVARGPSMIDKTALQDRIESMKAAARAEGEEPRTRELQYRLFRRMLDDAVVYQDDLNQHEIDYYRHQRSRLLQELELATGLVPEVRREGVALLDAEGDLSDFRLPEQGTRGHAVLLVAEWLARRTETTANCVVTTAELTEYVRSLAREHGAHWRKDVAELYGMQQLTEDVLRVMESLRLLLRRGDRIVPLPAIARYRLAHESDTSVRHTRQRSLL